MRVHAGDKLDEILEKRYDELTDKELEVLYLPDEEEEELDNLTEWYEKYQDYLLATLDITDYYQTQGVTFV